jgi:hypothetical protein
MFHDAQQRVDIFIKARPAIDWLSSDADTHHLVDVFTRILRLRNFRKENLSNDFILLGLLVGVI